MVLEEMDNIPSVNRSSDHNFQSCMSPSAMEGISPIFMNEIHVKKDLEFDHNFNLPR